jgi:hypothetical protein
MDDLSRSPAASVEGPPRPAPEVIQLPLLKNRATRPAVKWAAGLLLFVAGVFHFWVGFGGWGAVVSLAYFGFGALVVWRLHRGNAAHLRARQEFLERVDRLADREVREALRRLWEDPYHRPHMRGIADGLARQGNGDLPPARVVCFGEFSIPPVQAYRFEPEIISPTRRRAREFLGIPLSAASLCVMVLLVRVGHWSVIPLILVALGAFVGCLAVGLRGVVMWTLESLLRPTYIRVAPGMIQAVHFHLARNRPSVQRFPVAPGTVIVLEGRRVIQQVAVRRGGQWASFDLTFASNPETASIRIWQAILSTAPTPPLSDEGLVG